MVKLYVSIKTDYLYCGDFSTENAALKWFVKNKHSFQELDGTFGTPVTVKVRKR